MKGDTISVDDDSNEKLAKKIECEQEETPTDRDFGLMTNKVILNAPKETMQAVRKDKLSKKIANWDCLPIWAKLSLKLKTISSEEYSALQELEIDEQFLPPIEVRGRRLSYRPRILKGDNDLSQLDSEANKQIQPRKQQLLYDSDEYDEDNICFYSQSVDHEGNFQRTFADKVSEIESTPVCFKNAKLHQELEAIKNNFDNEGSQLQPNKDDTSKSLANSPVTKRQNHLNNLYKNPESNKFLDKSREFYQRRNQIKDIAMEFLD